MAGNQPHTQDAAMLDAPGADVRNLSYIEEPTAADLLRALPRSLNTSARLTMLAYWHDAGRASGPTELTLDEVRACTGLSEVSQRRVIRTLEKGQFLSPSERVRFAGGIRWVRIVNSPLVISPEGGR